MTNHVKHKKGKKRHNKILRRILLSLFIFILIITVCLGGLVLGIIKTSPPLNVNKILDISETSKLYDDKGNFIDNLITSQKRIPISINEVPTNLKNAFISIEDERFIKHNGIDLKRIAGAFFVDIKNKLTHKSGLQGASTITQQLLKNTILGTGDTFAQKMQRKIREAYLAIKLEKLLTKDQILEAYMNSIFLGNNSCGVGAAAEQYFSKSIKDLNLIECAYIAGLPQSPTTYNYFSDASQKNPSIYLNRTKTVLSKMHDTGCIDDSQYSQAINDLNNGKLKFQKAKSIDKMNYEWFSRQAVKQVKQDLKDKYGYDDSEINSLLLYGGLEIYTTMDKDIQNSTQTILNDANNILGIKQTQINGIVQPQVGAVIMDYNKGEVKAIVGGRGTQPALSMNRACEDKNPCGSSIKPLTVYGPAIDTRIATASTIFDDSPLPIELQEKYGSNGELYNPKNSPNVYEGPMTLREGLLKSKNVIAIRIEDLIGIKTGAAYAEKFGLTLTESEKNSIAALSLGEIGGTDPLTMAAAYGVFGNNGMYSKPRFYTKVTDKYGKVILENQYTSKKVLSPQAAYIMYDLLKGPLSGQAGSTGSNANFSSMARGKTGTTSKCKDVWFCGLTPYYSASIWIGQDKNSQFNESPYEFGRYIGSNDAALLWGKIMASAHKNLPVKTIDMPSGVDQISICKDSGKIPNPFCITEKTSYTEYFINGTEPTEYCDIHGSEEKDETKDDDSSNNNDEDIDEEDQDTGINEDYEDILDDNEDNLDEYNSDSSDDTTNTDNKKNNNKKSDEDNQ